MNATAAQILGLVVLVGAVFLLLALLGARLGVLERRMAALGRIEGKLDLLLKQAGLKYDPLASIPADVAEAVRGNRKIEAIKLYRQATGVGLKDAKDYVEAVQKRAGLG